MSQSTSIRVNQSTVAELRLAGAELAVALREPINSDDERIMALVDYFHRTKTITSPAAVQEPAG